MFKYNVYLFLVFGILGGVLLHLDGNFFFFFVTGKDFGYLFLICFYLGSGDIFRIEKVYFILLF